MRLEIQTGHSGMFLEGQLSCSAFPISVAGALRCLAVGTGFKDLRFCFQFAPATDPGVLMCPSHTRGRMLAALLCFPVLETLELINRSPDSPNLSRQTSANSLKSFNEAACWLLGGMELSRERSRKYLQQKITKAVATKSPVRFALGLV